MTGPEGEQFPGWWRILVVEAPSRLEFKDGFTGDDGEPDNDMPTSRTEVTLERITDETTRMTMVSTFSSLEAMEQMLEMGVEEGIKQALGRIDGLLAAATQEA